MRTVSSSSFLKEFTLYANQAHDDKETFVIQRANEKNVVLLSMDSYNALQKELYLLKKEQDPKKEQTSK